MSSEQKPEVKKRRGTSIPLLIAFLVLGVGGYYAGPSIMTYVFLLQEKMIADSQDGGKKIPAPSTESNPIAAAGAGSEGAGSEGAGSEGAGSEGAGSEGAGSEGAGSEGAGSEGAGGSADAASAASSAGSDDAASSAPTESAPTEPPAAETPEATGN